MAASNALLADDECRKEGERPDGDSGWGWDGSIDKSRVVLSPGGPKRCFSGNSSSCDVTRVDIAARVIAGASGEWCRGMGESGVGMGNGVEWKTDSTAANDGDDGGHRRRRRDTYKEMKAVQAVRGLVGISN